MRQRIAIVQRDIVWQSVDANLDGLERMLQGVEADVVVLSEMFQTGFVTTPRSVADDGRTLSWMKRVVGEHNFAIVGTVVVKECENYYNRMYFVKPTGEVEYYDKHHLFSVGGESEHFTAGDRRVVVEWRGVRYLLEICYDLRFPVWSRNRGDYDAIIYSALWPKPRREVWRTLLRARAMENQAWVVGVNRIGAEPGLEYAGDSAIIDHLGRTIVDATNRECVEVVEMDVEDVARFRERFNVSRDADNFEIL
ncbi:MAG: nitrilase family protein [Alistipes sp.]|nr:nitrilase family protein [Alistipes sp.]